MSSHPSNNQFHPGRWLFWAAIAFAIGEILDSFSLDDPATGLVFAVLVAACAFWFRMRSSRIPAIVLLILAGFELIALIFIYPHGPTPPAPWRSAVFIVLSAAVALLSILSLMRPRTH